MTALRQLRLVAFLEGASFLVLLFVAMPLKYLAGLPPARSRDWPGRRTVTAFVASILPFGTFVFDASLRREIERIRSVAEAARA